MPRSTSTSTSCRYHVARRARVRRRLRPPCAGSGLGLRARPAGRRVQARPRSRCPAATRSARGRWTCTSAGLRQLGAEFGIEHGYIVAAAVGLRGAQIWLDFPSVGATENILTAAVLAKGTTVDRQRRARTRDRRPVRDARRDGRADRRRRFLDAGDHRRGRAARRPSTRVSATASWPAPGLSPRRPPGATSRHAAPTPQHLEIALDKLVRAGATSTSHATGSAS